MTSPSLLLYGVHLSRAPRCQWLLEELGLEYRLIEQMHKDGAAQVPEFLALNPNGKTPVLVDGDAVIWESMAINLYIAMTYGRAPLWPRDSKLRGIVFQWTFWSVTEAEPLLNALIMAKRKVGPIRDQQRSPAEVEKLLERPLAVLENSLKERDFLLGQEFSVADLNLASVLSFSVHVGVCDFYCWPHILRWLRRCWGRPAYARVGWAVPSDSNPDTSSIK